MPLPDDVRELLQAIFEAVDVPLPANTSEDIADHNRLLGARAADVRIQLGSLLNHPDLFTLTETAGKLREWTASSPVTYRAQDGSQL